MAALVVAAYFLYFAIPALRAGFAGDDPMNAGKYWMIGFWRSMADVAMFWSTAYRPLGALFYLPLYHIFGFAPLPFRIAALALVAANIVLTWRIADLLFDSKAAAALAAMLATAHASMGAILFNTSMIYDILAYFFLAWMLIAYMTARRAGEISLARGALIALLFIAALDSKELAVVGSGWVLAYELLRYRPPRLRLPIFLCLISIAYTLGKFLGKDPLAQQEGYRLEPTLHRFFLNNRLYLNDIFYTQFFSSSRRVWLLWIALGLICAIARRRELWWCWLVMLTAPLGISFTIQPRGGSGLYLPLFAWALLASGVALVWFRENSSRQWAAAAMIALIAGRFTIHYWRDQPKIYLDWHAPTTATLAQMRTLPKPAPHSRVIFLNDPFPDGYDVEFMAMLLWNDPTLQIDLGNKFQPLPDLAQYQWILKFHGTGVEIEKRP